LSYNRLLISIHEGSCMPGGPKKLAIPDNSEKKNQEIHLYLNGDGELSEIKKSAKAESMPSLSLHAIESAIEDWVRVKMAGSSTRNSTRRLLATHKANTEKSLVWGNNLSKNLQNMGCVIGWQCTLITPVQQHSVRVRFDYDPDKKLHYNIEFLPPATGKYVVQLDEQPAKLAIDNVQQQVEASFCERTCAALNKKQNMPLGIAKEFVRHSAMKGHQDVRAFFGRLGPAFVETLVKAANAVVETAAAEAKAAEAAAKAQEAAAKVALDVAAKASERDAKTSDAENFIEAPRLSSAAERRQRQRLAAQKQAVKDSGFFSCLTNCCSLFFTTLSSSSESESKDSIAAAKDKGLSRRKIR
jgi:hypothetical protein